ncbi:MAG: FeoA family protein [Mycoplasma sp.]
MKSIPISLELKDKFVKVDYIDYKEEPLVNKLRNLGIFKNQIIYIKSVGNNDKMIAIEINDVTNIFRTKDAKHIYVIEVSKGVK